MRSRKKGGGGERRAYLVPQDRIVMAQRSLCHSSRRVMTRTTKVDISQRSRRIFSNPLEPKRGSGRASERLWVG